LTINRRRFTLPRVGAVAAAVVLIAFALHAALWRPLDLTGAARDDGYTRVVGVIHVHTTFSDGGGSPEDVVAAARAAGLGFVAITDHNTLDAKPLEGYRDGVLVLVGSEVSTTAGHVLALGIPDPVFRFSGDARDALEDIRDLGGIAFAAHPWHPRQDFRWTGWHLPGAWGLEILNLDSDWRRASWARVATATVSYAVNHRYGMLSALDATSQPLRQWDELLAERDTPGIVGTDAHARIPITKSWSVSQPSYESLFSVARNHVLLKARMTGDAGRDTALLLDALRRGASYSAIDALAPANAFSFTIEADGRRFTMGDTAPAAANARLVVGGRLPADTTLAVLRDGREVANAHGAIDMALPGAGVYRVEAHVRGWNLPWVVTNPIYVFDEATQRARAEKAAWPRQTPPPAAVQTIDAFDGGSIFRAGCDPSSSVDRDVLDPKGGVDGGGAAKLTFRLGQGATPGDASCEFVNRESRSLARRKGLVFSIRSDRPYRVWVQVRDENPKTSDGTESWFASVRTSTEWRRVAVPFAAMRSTDPTSDGTLDLEKVRAVGFVLDRGAVKLGTEGTIWIDEVGVY